MIKKITDVLMFLFLVTTFNMSANAEDYIDFSAMGASDNRALKKVLKSPIVLRDYLVGQTVEFRLPNNVYAKYQVMESKMNNGLMTIVGDNSQGHKMLLSQQGSDLNGYLEVGDSKIDVVTSHGRTAVYFPSHGDDAHEPVGLNDYLIPPAAPTKRGGSRYSRAQKNGVPNIDIMFVYTSSFAGIYGSSLDSRLNFLITLVGQVFSDSGVSVNVRLVHSELTVYSNATTAAAALSDLTNGNGVFSGIEETRQKKGADLVALLGSFTRVQSDAGVCGRAWLNGFNLQERITPFYAQFGYSASFLGAVNLPNGSRSICSDLVLVHELGHNMGLAHSRNNSNVSKGVFEYSHGHGVDGEFRTVMGVGIRAPRLPVFSNLTVGCNGRACGVAGVSDASRSLNAIIQDVSNFVDEVGQRGASAVLPSINILLDEE